MDLLFIFFLTLTSPYLLPTTLSQFNAQFSSLGLQKHNVTHLANSSQSCDGHPCDFYFYSYQNTSFSQNLTLFLVSGMHGNEVLGPLTLLNAVLRARRIIYFPMANPSGFSKRTRLTHPSAVDPNRDFPFDDNTHCYLCASTLIIDHIFRTYSIDLSVSLHEGSNAVSFNWGDRKTITPDHLIAKQISQMLSLYGGANSQCGIKKLSTGTMTDAVYLVNGTYEDWAYGASKYPSKKCQNNQPQQYTKDMFNGLVFLWELGVQNAQTKCYGDKGGQLLNPQDTSLDNGLITRGVRMLQHLVNIMHPIVNISATPNTLWVKVNGCYSAVMKLTVKKGINETVMEGMQIKGDLHPEYGVVEVAVKNIAVGDEVEYEIEMVCDKHWQGLGTTAFAKERKYKRNGRVKVLDKIAFQEHPVLDGRGITKYMHWIIILCIALLGCIIVVIPCFRWIGHKIALFGKTKRVYLGEKFEFIEEIPKEQRNIKEQNKKIPQFEQFE